METEADQLMCRERGRSEEARLSRNGLTWVVCLPPPGGGHGDDQAWVAAKGHVLVHGPDAAMEICVDVCGACYHRKLRRCPSSGLLPRDMLAFEGHLATGAILIWVTYDAR